MYATSLGERKRLWRQLLTGRSLKTRKQKRFVRCSFQPFALGDFSGLCSVASDVTQEVRLKQTEQMAAFPKVPDLCGWDRNRLSQVSGHRSSDRN